MLRNYGENRNATGYSAPQPLPPAQQTALQQQRILTLRNLCFSYYNYYNVYTTPCKVEDKKSVETIDCKNKLKTAINKLLFPL
jgi:hypothetical protein